MHKTYLVTGGAGFIGSNYIYHLLTNIEDITIYNLDKLTYAGNLNNLQSIEKDSRYKFIKGDIADQQVVLDVMSKKIDIVVNFAAETHVDRSILDPAAFIKTDVLGTYNLLEQARLSEIECFVQISTDEVYGSITTGSATEEGPLMPTNPYSASKSGADRLAFSYFKTYDLPVIITRCSNNFGPYQYPEKLIPLCITNLIEGKKVPLYGDGKNVRDWIDVEDHCRAIQFCINNGTKGNVYNISGDNELENICIIQSICDLLQVSSGSIEFIKDRPGHDKRYSLDSSKIKRLGFTTESDFFQSLQKTVNWYKENQDWWQPLKSGEYLEYYKKQYINR